MNSILGAVRETAAQVFGLPVDAITPESSPESIGEWDSTLQLYLILALEDRFAVELAPEDMDNFRTIGEIAGMLDHRLEQSTI